MFLAMLLLSCGGENPGAEGASDPSECSDGFDND